MTAAARVPTTVIFDLLPNKHVKLMYGSADVLCRRTAHRLRAGRWAQQIRRRWSWSLQ